MHGSERHHFDCKRSRTRPGDAHTAGTALDPNLGAVGNLSFIYWRPRSYLSEAPDEDPLELSAGQIARKPVHSKTHADFSPNPVPSGIGFKVYFCSPKKSTKDSRCQCIQRGCTMGRKADPRRLCCSIDQGGSWSHHVSQEYQCLKHVLFYYDGLAEGVNSGTVVIVSERREITIGIADPHN